jgi:hypothetical protein
MGVLGLEDMLEAADKCLLVGWMAGKSISPSNNAQFTSGCPVVERAVRFLRVTGKSLMDGIVIFRPIPKRGLPGKNVVQRSLAILAAEPTIRLLEQLCSWRFRVERYRMEQGYRQSKAKRAADRRSFHWSILADGK